MIRFQTDIKYQLYEDTKYDLQLQGILITKSYDGKFYGVDKEQRVLWAKAGFAWDGASCFPDFNWILESSLWHDVLHLLIAQGVIPVSENNKIDEELARAIRLLGGAESDGRIADTLLKIRSGYVQRATNLVHQKVVQARPVYELNQGKRRRIK
jgi:hypothetical protein